MQLFGKVLERAITSLVMSILLIFCSFSFMTGKFPPSKQDFVKSYNLMRAMVSGTKEFNAKAAEMQNMQASGGELNLQQVVEFQKLSLKRTEISMELMSLFKRIPTSSADPVLQLKLNQISMNLENVEKGIAEVGEHFQNMQNSQLGSNSLTESANSISQGQ